MIPNIQYSGKGKTIEIVKKKKKRKKSVAIRCLK